MVFFFCRTYNEFPSFTQTYTKNYTSCLLTRSIFWQDVIPLSNLMNPFYYTNDIQFQPTRSVPNVTYHRKAYLAFQITRACVLLSHIFIIIFFTVLKQNYHITENHYDLKELTFCLLCRALSATSCYKNNPATIYTSIKYTNNNINKITKNQQIQHRNSI